MFIETMIGRAVERWFDRPPTRKKLIEQSRHMRDLWVAQKRTSEILANERDGLLWRGVGVQRELDELRAEIERLKKELEEAEKETSDANGVMDSIDTTVANALESLGLDTCVGHGFPWRVDKLIEAAKDRNEYKARLNESAAERERLSAIIENRDEDVANALAKIRRSSPPPKNFEERVNRLVDAVKELEKFKADVLKHLSYMAMETGYALMPVNGDKLPHKTI